MPVFNVGDRVVMTQEETACGMNGDMERWLANGTILEIEALIGVIGGFQAYRVGHNGIHWVVRENALRLSDGTVPAPPPEPKKTLTDRQLIAKAKVLLKKTSDKGNNGIAILVDNRPSKTLSVSTGPCHGFVRDRGDKHIVAIVSRIVRKCTNYSARITDPILLEKYYDFIMNRSPWSQCFMYKSAKQALVNKCVVLKTDVPANLMQGALISTRHPWEFPTRVTLWDELTKAGVDEHTAFLAMFMADSTGDSKQVKTSTLCHDHTPVAALRMTKADVLAFKANTPVYKQMSYNKGGSYQGVHRAFCKGQGDGATVERTFNTKFKQKANEKSFSAIINPFSKAKPSSRGDEVYMSYAKYAEFVKEFFTEFVA